MPKRVNTDLTPSVFFTSDFFRISKEIGVQKKENLAGGGSSYSYYSFLEHQIPKQNVSIEEMLSFISPVIKEPELKGSLDEVFGLWKGRNVRLDTIREQQWGRKIK